MRCLITWKKLALAGALCTSAWLAHASDAPDAQCRVPVDDRGALPDRKAALSRMEQMSDVCLKRLLFQCGDAANQRVMDLGSASTCSMGYEALLHKSFGGDFVAMLTWWRGERAAHAPTP